MAHRIIKNILFIATVFLAISCRNESNPNVTLTEEDTTVNTEEVVAKARSVFYRMYLPNEMYKVFEKAGAIYSPEILNPVENVNLYESSTKAALNLGVYGVDLSYNKIFGQNQKTLLYFTVIHKLSQQLGIPDNIFSKALKKMEQNLSNRDSLTEYATDVFSSTHKFLNENDRKSTAALVIAGGWIEALYIASKISDDDVENEEIIERIAFQKYSLRSLMSMLANYQTEPSVNRYYLLFKALNNAYNEFEIYYFPDDVSIDTINKLINSQKVNIDLPAEKIEKIKKIIAQIRQEITM